MNLRGKLTRKDLLGSFFSFHLEREELTPAELCRRIGIAQTQFAQWAKGHDTIPNHHLMNLKEALALSDADFVSLSYLNCLMIARHNLGKLLTGNRRTKRHDNGLAPGISDSFSDGPTVLSDVLQYCEFMAAEDLRIFTNMDWAKALYTHVNAAAQVAKDLNEFVTGNGGEIFSAKNILLHLRYPYNYHFGFYLNYPLWSGPPPSDDFIKLIWESITQAARQLGSDDLLQNRIAQHATHLVSRFDATASLPLERKIRSADLETQRMALFGEAYRNGDAGDVEKLTHRMAQSDVFADLVLAFDALHYGDFRIYRSDLEKDRIPINAALRHVAGIGNAKLYLRKLSSARLTVLLDRYESHLRRDPASVASILTIRATIDGNLRLGPEEISVLDRIDAMSLKIKREG